MTTKTGGSVGEPVCSTSTDSDKQGVLGLIAVLLCAVLVRKNNRQQHPDGLEWGTQLSQHPSTQRFPIFHYKLKPKLYLEVVSAPTTMDDREEETSY